MVHNKSVSEHQVRTRIRNSDHKRVVLYAERNDDRVIDAYRTIIRIVLDHDGRVKPEADKTSVQFSLKTFKLILEKQEEYGVTADVLVFSLLTTKNVLKKRIF